MDISSATHSTLSKRYRMGGIRDGGNSFLAAGPIARLILSLSVFAEITHEEQTKKEKGTYAVLFFRVYKSSLRLVPVSLLFPSTIGLPYVSG